MAPKGLYMPMKPLDLLLPTTDAGVLAQLTMLVLLGSVFIWRFRSHTEARLIVVGLLLVGGGAIALRAVH